MVDTFIGTFQVESRDNFDAFMTGIGVPAEYIEAARKAKVVTEFKKSGDVISVTRTRPQKTTNNSFRLGEETEMENIKGDKMKVPLNGELSLKCVAQKHSLRVEPGLLDLVVFLFANPVVYRTELSGRTGEIVNVVGHSVLVKVNLEGGKLVVRGDKYEVINEIVGGKLKETITLKGHTMSRISARQ